MSETSSTLIAGKELLFISLKLVANDTEFVKRGLFSSQVTLIKLTLVMQDWCKRIILWKVKTHLISLCYIHLYEGTRISVMCSTSKTPISAPFNIQITIIAPVFCNLSTTTLPCLSGMKFIQNFPKS